jgi:hypothetical protein
MAGTASSISIYDDGAQLALGGGVVGLGRGEFLGAVCDDSFLAILDLGEGCSDSFVGKRPVCVEDEGLRAVELREGQDWGGAQGIS